MIEKIKQLIFDILFRQTIIISSDESLWDKVVLITGAGRGIGKAIATVLSKQGAKLALMSIDKKQLEKAFPIYDKDRVFLLKGDVSSEDDCKKAIKITIEKFGRIDVLMNNAGIIFTKPLEETSSEDWDNVSKTNVKGMFLMAKAVIPYMKKQRYGLIINMGSRISHNANIASNMTLYASTKYAIEGFSNALDSELRPYGIRVTCLMPGTVNTFRSLRPRNFLSPFRIAQIIATIIKMDDVNFESVIFRSKRQNL